MYEHNALGYWLGLALCLTKVSSSRARCPATALIYIFILMNKYKFTLFKTCLTGNSSPSMVSFVLIKADPKAFLEDYP